MNIIWLVIAIILLIIIIWLFLQPKQGERASNAPSPRSPDRLPSGVKAVSPKEKPEAFQKQRTPMTPPLSLEDEVRQLLDSGQKIVAIKRVREVQHWGLKEAKDYVDAFEKQDSPPLFEPQVSSTQLSDSDDSDIKQEVKRLLAAHQKVSAVKLVRDRNQWDLRKAKEFVDAIQEEEFHTMDREVSNLFSDPMLKQEVQQLLRNHQRLNAVKRVKESTGWELSQAMDYVTRVERDLDAMD